MKNSLLAAVTLTLFAFQSPAYAEDLEFTLYNDSSADLVEFNLSRASSDDWESNLLKGDYLASGYEIEVLVADGLSTCFYDVRGAFEDGTEAEDYNLNLCDLGEYTFTD